MEIVQYGDPVLEAVGEPVTKFDASLRELVDNLGATLKAHPEGVAVAAPQVGVSKRVFVYNTGTGLHAVVNPKIVEFSRDGWMYKEGCLSFRDHFWYINRPKTVHVEYQDERGAVQYQQHTEFEGRLFQHEIDHLDGVLILSHLTKSERKAALRELVR